MIHTTRIVTTLLLAWAPSLLCAQGNMPKILFPNSKPEKCAGWCELAVKHGGLPEVAKYVGPICVDKGYQRVFCHNIGGIWTLHDWDSTRTWNENRKHAEEHYGLSALGTSPMRPNQWLLAEQAGVPWADREELALFHHRLTNDYGITEVIYYLGAPHQIGFEHQKLSLEPFIELEGASFAFDAVHKPWHFEANLPIFKWIKAENPTARIYTEGHPNPDVDPKPYRKWIDGSIALQRSNITMPDRLENAQQVWKHEIITVCNTADEDVPGVKALREWGWRENPR